MQIVILLIGFLNFAAAEHHCTGVLPPGLAKLRKGVDVTTLEMLPLDIIEAEGFKGAVIDYTCSLNRQWRNPGNMETYHIPDEVDVTSIPGGVMNSHVQLHETTSSVTRARAGSMGLSFLAGMFSGSGSTKKMTSTITEKSSFIADVSAFHSAFRADMAPYWSLNISRHARDFIDESLPENYESDPEPFVEFIKYFGTHYFINGKFGGLFRDYMEIKKDLWKTMSEQQIKADVGASFLKMVKASGGYDGNVKSTSSAFDASTEHFVKYYGGHANFFGDPKEAWQRWEISVPGDPWMFSGKLAPLTDLIQDEKKKEALATAVLEHIDRAFLEGLKSHHNTVLDRTTASNINYKISSEIRSIEKLLALPYGKLKHDNGKLQIMRSSIDLPTWFTKKTKLCYHWYPDGDGGQCGGGASRNLCAKINSMTPWYRDDTDRRSGGCRMKWGIVSEDYSRTDLWFSAVQICYQWYADGNGGQCGGGAPSLTCATVGSFTSVYRDDTDRRSGGCRMRWKLVVMGHAPMWIWNAKLCFEWYPDGDGGQCGGGVGRKLCAAVNQWTTYYRDDTDRRGGGCQMRWGIVI